MNKLNKTFLSGNVLTAAELNLLTSKIDEIINNFPTSTGSTNPADGVTQQDITNKVNAAKAELLVLISLLDRNFSDLLVRVNNIPTGNNETNTDTESIRTVKDDLGIAFRYMGITKNEDNTYSYNTQFGSSAIIDGIGTALAAIQTDVNTNGDTLVGIRANYYQDGTDSNGKPIYKPVYDGASIIASINSTGESTVGISANKITLDGDTTLTGKLTALSADIANINVPDTATIANAVINDGRIQSAVISDIEAGDVTITGTLHYNKIIGNVELVSEDTYLNGNSYFVQFTGSFSADSSNWPTIFLPSTLDGIETGQTIFLDCGTRCFNLATTGPSVQVYYLGTSSTDDPEIKTTTLTVPSNNGIKALDAGWNGVVLFIYNGSIWVQLIHNITVHQ